MVNQNIMHIFMCQFLLKFIGNLIMPFISGMFCLILLKNFLSLAQVNMMAVYTHVFFCAVSLL